MKQTIAGQLMILGMVVVVACVAVAGGRKERDAQQAGDAQEGGANAGSPALESSPIEPTDPPTRDPAAGEHALWKIVEHPLGDSLESAISGTIEEGYTPTGIEVSEGGISVLYVRTDDVAFDRWTLQDVSADEDVNAVVTAWLTDGWLPMGLSVRGDTMLFLLVEADVDIAGWTLHDYALENVGMVVGLFDQGGQEGYTPYGISVDSANKRLWALMIQRGDRPAAPGVLFNGYPRATLTDGINTDMETGAVPWGLALGEQTAFASFLF